MSYDGVLLSEIHYQDHTDTVTHKVSQPTENIILDRNSELRKNKGAIQDLGAQSGDGTWGRQVACIPEIRYYEAIRDGYQLNSPDAKFAEKEVWRYLQSEKGKACLI